MSELTLSEKIDQNILPRFLELGIDEGTAKKEASFALQHMEKNAQLMKCSDKSKLQAVLNIAQCGLTLNPVSKQAYLVPRWSKDGMMCVLEPSYIGLIKLLTDTGSVKHISAQVIHEGDEIEIDLASVKKVIKHVPYILTSKDKGSIIGVYSTATLVDGSVTCEVMGLTDIEYIRGKSESYKAYEAKKLKNCTWVSDYAEMCRKSVIKRHSKYLPRTDRWKQLDEAVNLDHQANGFREEVSSSTMVYVDELLRTVSVDGKHLEHLEYQISQIEYQDEASKVIEFLKENQVEAEVLNQTGVLKKLDAIDSDPSK